MGRIAKGSGKTHRATGNALTVTATDAKTLRGEFDDLLARLQTTRSRKALKSAFEATPKELGRLAVANKRRHG